MFPEYEHYGEVFENALDMRAEIGVTTRNIVIEGELSLEEPAYGGHLKVKPS